MMKKKKKQRKAHDVEMEYHSMHHDVITKKTWRETDSQSDRQTEKKRERERERDQKEIQNQTKIMKRKRETEERRKI